MMENHIIIEELFIIFIIKGGGNIEMKMIKHSKHFLVLIYII